MNRAVFAALISVILSGCSIESPCGQDYHYNKNDECVIDSDIECGASLLNCSALPGIANARCNQDSEGKSVINKKCSVQYCEDNYHLTTGFFDPEGSINANGDVINYCVKDTAKECGSKKIDCTAIEGGSNAACVEGICTFDCQAGFHSAENKCEADSEKACGPKQTDCSAIIGAADTVCKDGKCVIESCREHEGYSLFGGQCVLVQACTNDAQCIQGVVTDARCIEHACVALGCKNGYHLYEDSCEEDNRSHCGFSRDDCTNISGAYADCIEGQCKATECKLDYHMTAIGCVEDSDKACGPEMTDCTKEVGTVSSCIHGKCSINDCQAGYHPVLTSCEKDTDHACGKNALDCTSIPHGTGSCKNTVCVYQCDTGYHLENNACVQDTWTACGAKAESCKNQIANSNKGSCVDGKCVLSTCQSGYYKTHDGKCVTCYQGDLKAVASNGVYVNNDIYCINGSLYMDENITSVTMNNLESLSYITSQSVIDYAAIGYPYDAIQNLKSAVFPNLRSIKGIFLSFNKGESFTLPYVESLEFMVIWGVKLIDLPSLKRITGDIDCHPSSSNNYFQMVNCIASCEIDLSADVIKTPLLSSIHMSNTCMYIGEPGKNNKWTSFPSSISIEPEYCIIDFYVASDTSPLYEVLKKYYIKEGLECPTFLAD